MSSQSKEITAPKRFRANTIISFLRECEVIYSLVGKRVPDYYLDLGRITDCDMIGVLIVYKTMEFSINNFCLHEPGYRMSKQFQDAMLKYGFTKLIISYVNETEREQYKELINLEVTVKENFIIAPKALLRGDQFSTGILNKTYLPKIQEYYSFSPKAVNMIFQCFSEILLNFWEHAVDDDKSIIVANGSKQKIEIACADNGNGILTTLKQAGKEKENNVATLVSAVEKGVTSKDLSNHMGYGLWIIDEIINRTGGRLHLYSQGTYYLREGTKQYSGKCGYWQGTIIYISVPIKNPITLADIETEKNDDLQINWT